MFFTTIAWCFMCSSLCGMRREDVTLAIILKDVKNIIEDLRAVGGELKHIENAILQKKTAGHTNLKIKLPIKKRKIEKRD